MFTVKRQVSNLSAVFWREYFDYGDIDAFLWIECLLLNVQRQILHNMFRAQTISMYEIYAEMGHDLLTRQLGNDILTTRLKSMDNRQNVPKKS